MGRINRLGQSTGGTVEVLVKKEFKLPANIRRTAGHSRKIGVAMHLQGVDWAEITIPYHEAYAADGLSGTVSLSPIPTLIDSACAAAILTRAQKSLRFATLDLRIDYRRTARRGYSLFARGHCYELTDVLALTSAVVHDGDSDDIIAHATCSFYISEE